MVEDSEQFSRELIADLIFRILHQAEIDWARPRRRKEIMRFINSPWFEDLISPVTDHPEVARQAFIRSLETQG